MRSRQHDAYPEETLETRELAMRLDWFVVNVIVVYFINPRYIFIVRRLSNRGNNPNRARAKLYLTDTYPTILQIHGQTSPNFAYKADSGIPSMYILQAHLQSRPTSDPVKFW